MDCKLLREGENYKVFGTVVDGFEIIDFVAIQDGESIDIYPRLPDRRRRDKNWFKRPTVQEAQEIWLADRLKSIKR